VAIEWYYSHDGKERCGPVSSEELQSLAKSGRLTPSDWVCRQGTLDWFPASRVQRLFSSTQPVLPPLSGESRREPAKSTQSFAPPFEALATESAQQQANGARGESAVSMAMTAWLPGALAVAGLIIAAALYYWSMPLTPFEVCRRIENCGEPREAAPYLTFRMQPAFAAIGGLKGSPNDRVEWGAEEHAPPAWGGRLVRCRFESRAAVAEYRGLMDLAFHLVQADGAWKIDDLVYLAKDEVPFEPPRSLVAMHSAGLLPIATAALKPPAERTNYALWGALMGVLLAGFGKVFMRLCRAAENRWNGGASRG